MIVSGAVAQCPVDADLDHCAAVGRLDAGWFCSGVLIHPRIVLTTAHSGPRGGLPIPRAVALRVTDLSALSGAEVMEGEFVAHEDYAGRGCYDLGAMILDRASAVIPVSLATAPELAAQTEVTLAGFGACREIRGAGLRIRRSVTVPIWCFLHPEPNLVPFNPDVEFIAGVDDGGPCFGDSGGPAYIAVAGLRKLAGIISRPAARKEPFCNGPTILTRIDAFADWISRLISRVAGSC